MSMIKIRLRDEIKIRTMKKNLRNNISVMRRNIRKRREKYKHMSTGEEFKGKI